MAIDFTNLHGKAIKQEVNYFKFVDGSNVFRMVGPIVARYVYWLKSNTGNNIPVECLSFDRDEERFTNIEKDWVRDFFPTEKCSWAYAVNVLDIKEGSHKVLALKKKMFEQIITVAEDLGDPTDLETGYDIYVKRTKTGSHAFNVEYQVQQLKLKTRALTLEEIAVVEEMKPIEILLPRPGAEDQKSFIERFIMAPAGDTNEDKEAVDDLTDSADDNIPF